MDNQQDEQEQEVLSDEIQLEETQDEYIKRMKDNIIGKDHDNLIKLIPLKDYLLNNDRKMSKGYLIALNKELKIIINKSIERSKKRIIKDTDL